ncbi:MAG: hypothetical protein JWR47_3396 [Phenylobacterium sp.]|nr:hypothetical protein [Phenylobacterium sp.]
MSNVDVSAIGGDRVVLSQRGVLMSFAWLSLRNGLLNLITLTLYRFWGKTEVRRRLWATTYLNDEAFEYTGRGVELFVGFLLALVVIALPFLCIIFGAQFLGPGMALLVILPSYLFLFFIAGLGRFTAFRYLATRTAWRGVRFHMRGTARSFGLAWMGYALLSGITFGWFWPAADRRLAGRLWDGLSFGDRDFQFRIDDARREPVYGAYALSWVLGVVGYIVFIGVIFAALYPQMKANGGSGAPPVITLSEMITIYSAAGGLALFYAVALSPFHAAMLRSIVTGIGFQDVRFRLRLRWFDMAGLTVSNIVLLTVSLGLLMPFVEARTRKFLISRLETTGEFDMSAVGQAQGLRPRTGEGLADAFGIATI